MSVVKWQTPAAIASLLTTGLNSLANNGYAVSAAVDNDTGKHRYADFELVATYGTNPSAGAFVSLFLVESVDGTNYADGDASIAPPATALIGIFPIRAVTTAQRVAIRQVALSPFKFKIVIRNETGQAMAASGNTVKYCTYNEEVV